jgi:hypothetical protein
MQQGRDSTRWPVHSHYSIIAPYGKQHYGAICDSGKTPAQGTKHFEAILSLAGFLRDGGDNHNTTPSIVLRRS